MESVLTQDTIAAIATPKGAGAIAILRLSGPQAIEIASRCWQGTDLSTATSHTVHLGFINDADNNPIDEVLLTIMRAPRTYTGEDTIEISCHGSQWLQRTILNRLMQCGARPAKPGEYTQRAFLNGRIDLTKAEAIADMIATSSQAAQRIAMNQMKGNFHNALEELRQQILHLASLFELELDFSEEDVEFASRPQMINLLTEIKNRLDTIAASFSTGNAIKDGIPVAIIGPANAGKSSLLNALLNENKAIVSDIPGTTRDTIEDTIEIGDYLFRFIDTAGLRQTDDKIEQIGIERAKATAAKADIILYITDATAPTPHTIDPTITAQLPPTTRIIHIQNKTDLLPTPNSIDPSQTQNTIKLKNKTEDQQTINLSYKTEDQQTIKISAKTGEGIEALKKSLTAQLPQSQTDIIITNARHLHALQQSSASARQALEGLQTNQTPDLISQDLRQLIHHLAEITGAITTPEILQSIFTTFCIGK